MSPVGYSGAPEDSYQRSASIKGTDTTTYTSEPPPSISKVNEIIKSSTASQRTLQQQGQVYTPAPNQSDMRHVAVSLANDSRGLVSKVQQPSMNDLVRRNVSKPGEGIANTNKRALERTGLAPIYESSVEGESASRVNKSDHVGICVAGKKFRNVNPTAYYLEKKVVQVD